MPGKPIATKGPGICFAFPNVCWTPIPPPPPGSKAPIPYPSIGQLSAADPVAEDVKAGGNKVIIKDSEIASTTGDSAGTLKGVKSDSIGGVVKFTSASETVKANGVGVVRMFDTTTQNKENCVGKVLGGFPKVMVGD